MNRLLIVVALGAVALVGCSQSDSFAVVAGSASSLVATYCKAPVPARILLREQIAQGTAPNRIRVECAADAF